LLARADEVIEWIGAMSALGIVAFCSANATTAKVSTIASPPHLIESKPATSGTR
jgi:hypothetical protein